MAEIKTKVNDASVMDFIQAVSDAKKKEEGIVLLKMFEEITGEEAKMWGSSIIGFGKYHYKSERSAQEGDWLMVGFSPRKASHSVYVLHGFEGEETLLEKLGKHKRGMGCLYINKLSDVDEKVLREIIKKSYHYMKVKYPPH